MVGIQFLIGRNSIKDLLKIKILVNPHVTVGLTVNNRVVELEINFLRCLLP